jgi:hypothetical protein
VAATSAGVTHMLTKRVQGGPFTPRWPLSKVPATNDRVAGPIVRQCAPRHGFAAGAASDRRNVARCRLRAGESSA